MFESNDFVHMNCLLELPLILAKTIDYLITFNVELFSFKHSNWQVIFGTCVPCWNAIFVVLDKSRNTYFRIDLPVKMTHFCCVSQKDMQTGLLRVSNKAQQFGRNEIHLALLFINTSVLGRPASSHQGFE